VANGATFTVAFASRILTTFRSIIMTSGVSVGRWFLATVISPALIGVTLKKRHCIKNLIHCVISLHL
jgi:hypothetical protein